jgi:ABC-type phosphate/phosphonate transport system substrate-binding protein
VVTDPLAERFACDCTPPSLRRDYEKLRGFLEERLRCTVRITYAEDLRDAFGRAGGEVDLMVGKRSVILHHAAENEMSVRAIVMLTDNTGTTQLRGVFVVRSDDPAKSVSDLQGYRILLGPKSAAEKHDAALEKLKAGGVSLPEPIRTSPRCTVAALAVYEKVADAAVISSYAVAYFEGGKVVPKGALRAVGETDPVPFLTVFATPALSVDEETAVVRALLVVPKRPALLSGLLSKDGFVGMTPRGDQR